MFRSFSSAITREVFMEKINALIIVSADPLRNSFYQKENDKINILKEVNWEEDIVLFSWVGKWAADVFQIHKEDIVFLNIENNV